MSKFFKTYIPPGEMQKPEAERRAYQIKPLSKLHFWEFLASADASGQAAIQVELQVIERGLTALIGINDADGNSVQWDHSRETLLKHVPVTHARGLVKEIIGLSVLADDEAKN